MALLHIRGQLLVERRPPTLVELGQLLGKSTSYANFLMNALMRKGYVRRERAKSRALTLVGCEPYL